MSELDVEALKRLRDRRWEPGLTEPAAIGELQAALPAIIAALEDRKRLRAAAEAVYVDEAGFCHGIGKLRAALEGRDA